MNLEILSVLLITSISCSIIGVFIVLKKMSMLMDAIGHTALTGVVVAYLIIKDINSPFLIVGALVICLLTVYFIELLANRKIEKDVAVGLVFPLIFSLGILIIDRKLKNSQITVNSALFGKLEFVVFKRLVIKGIDLGPKDLYIMFFVTILTIIFLFLFYKEMKIISFDELFAKVSGVSFLIVYYLFVSLISLIAVVSFNIVGVILFISLVVGPSITSLLFSKNLLESIYVSIVIGIINCLIGYLVAYKYNLTISGVISSLNMLIFLLALFIKKKD